LEEEEDDDDDDELVAETACAVESAGDADSVSLARGFFFWSPPSLSNLRFGADDDDDDDDDDET